MSLINEALRKVQDQRTSAPELSGDESNTQAAHMIGRPNRSRLMIGLGICVVVLFGLVAGLTVLLMRKGQTSDFQGSKSLVPDKETIPHSEPATGFTDSQIKTSEVSEVVKVSAVTSEPNQEITDWLAQSKVTGMRISSTGKKVILNNKAFVPGEMVNANLELKVLNIEERRILFVDSKGVQYVKNL